MRLDPRYLSAWKQLASARDLLTPQQSDRVTLTLIELDPRGVHQGYGGGVSFEVKRDYRGLWQTTQRVLPRKRALSKANYALRSSQRQEDYQHYDVWELVKTPADAIAAQQFVRQIDNVMN